MKTYKNLYSQVYDFENLYLAWRKARKGKRGREGAAARGTTIKTTPACLIATTTTRTTGTTTSVFVWRPSTDLPIFVGRDAIPPYLPEVQTDAGQMPRQNWLACRPVASLLPPLPLGEGRGEGAPNIEKPRLFQ